MYLIIGIVCWIISIVCFSWFFACVSLYLFRWFRNVTTSYRIKHFARIVEPEVLQFFSSVTYHNGSGGAVYFSKLKKQLCEFSKKSICHDFNWYIENKDRDTIPPLIVYRNQAEDQYVILGRKEYYLLACEHGEPLSVYFEKSISEVVVNRVLGAFMNAASKSKPVNSITLWHS